jgi:hypothetical protein
MYGLHPHRCSRRLDMVSEIQGLGEIHSDHSKATRTSEPQHLSSRHGNGPYWTSTWHHWVTGQQEFKRYYPTPVFIPSLRCIVSSRFVPFSRSLRHPSILLIQQIFGLDREPRLSVPVFCVGQYVSKSLLVSFDFLLFAYAALKSSLPVVSSPLITQD